jgi:hypothetical protein
MAVSLELANLRKEDRRLHSTAGRVRTCKHSSGSILFAVYTIKQGIQDGHAAVRHQQGQFHRASKVARHLADLQLCAFPLAGCRLCFMAARPVEPRNFGR